MIKIIQSIKARPINMILIMLVLTLYFFNNNFLKANTTGRIHIFLVSYFNDLMCPYFFLGYANMLLITCNKELTSLKSILFVGLTGGFTWEFLAPILKSSSVTDPIDLACYALSTVGYWKVLKIFGARKDDIDD
jgi:hypothetical protein